MEKLQLCHHKAYQDYKNMNTPTKISGQHFGVCPLIFFIHSSTNRAYPPAAFVLSFFIFVENFSSVL